MATARCGRLVAMQGAVCHKSLHKNRTVVSVVDAIPVHCRGSMVSVATRSTVQRSTVQPEYQPLIGGVSRVQLIVWSMEGARER